MCIASGRENGHRVRHGRAPNIVNPRFYNNGGLPHGVGTIREAVETVLGCGEREASELLGYMWMFASKFAQIDGRAPDQASLSA